MRMKCLVLVMVVTLLGLASCKTTSKYNKQKITTVEDIEKVESASKDSVKIEYVKEVEYVETTIVEKDSATIKALLECNEKGEVILKQLLEYEAGKYTKPPEFSIVDNQLNIKNEVDSLQIYKVFKSRLSENTNKAESSDSIKVATDTNTKEKTTEEFKQTSSKKWYYLVGFLGFWLGLSLGYIVYKKLKLF